MVMIIANGTAANDRVNKYGEILLQEAIFTAYERQWRDVLPCNVNHDSTRRIGCSRLSAAIPLSFAYIHLHFRAVFEIEHQAVIGKDRHMVNRCVP